MLNFHEAERCYDQSRKGLYSNLEQALKLFSKPKKFRHHIPTVVTGITKKNSKVNLGYVDMDIQKLKIFGKKHD